MFKCIFIFTFSDHVKDSPLLISEMIYTARTMLLEHLWQEIHHLLGDCFCVPI